jgi:hypothetical protein
MAMDLTAYTFVGIYNAIRSDNAGNNPTVENNCYYKVLVPTTNSITGDFSGTDEVFADPGLTADYLIDATSPCAGVGKHVGYGTDVEGKQFYNPPSIGCYEYERPRISRT